MEFKPTYTSTIRHIYSNKESLRKAWKDEIRLEAGFHIPDYELDNLFDTRFKEIVLDYKNSVQGKTRTIGALDFIKETFDQDKIIVENGVFFQNSRRVFAPTVESEIHLFKERKRVKKLGNHYLTVGNDPVLGAIYDNLQKNIKILMNTYYGVLTNPYSRFFNRDLGDSITNRGRSSISVSAISIEGAFAKKIPKRLDALLAYWKRCIEGEIDKEILDEMLSYNWTAEDILREFNLTNHYAIKVLRRRLALMSPSDIAKIIYKNNFKLMSELPIFQNTIYNLFEMCELKETPYLDPNELPFKKVDGKTITLEEAKEPLNFIKKMVRQVLCGMYWYGGDYIQEKKVIVDNPQQVIQTIDRKTIPVIDTDSNFLSYETEYMYLYEAIKKLNKGTFVLKDAEEDNTFYTISNMCATIMCEVIDCALDRYKHHVNILPEKFDCLKLKNEFLFTKVLITSRKKSYLTVVALKEGKPYPQRKLDVKGMVFIKSSVNSNIGDRTKGMVDYIMMNDNFTMSEVLKQIRSNTNDVVSSHKNQALLDYCVALKIKTNLEETDMSDFRFKSITLWNALAENEADKILPPATFYAIPIQIKDSLKEKYPEIYDKVVAWLDARNTEMIHIQIKHILDEENGNKKKEFIKFVMDNFDISDIKNANDWKEIRAKAMKLKQERKLKIEAVDVNYMTIEDIDKIAFPLSLELVPEWLLEMVNPDNSLILMNNLIAPIVQELHLVCPRNGEDKRIVTNILDIY